MRRPFSVTSQDARAGVNQRVGACNPFASPLTPQGRVYSHTESRTFDAHGLDSTLLDTG